MTISEPQPATVSGQQRPAVQSTINLLDNGAAATIAHAQAGFQMIAGQTPAAQPPVRPPELGRMPPTALTFLTDGASAGLMVGVLRNHATVTYDEARRQPVVTMDREAAREEFERTLPAAMSPEHRRQIFDYTWYMFTQELYDAGARVLNGAIRSGNNAERDAAYEVGRATSDELAANGHGTPITNEQNFLYQAGRGCNQTQQEDMLRGALMSGFSTAAVFGAARQMGIGGLTSTTAAPNSAMATQQDSVIEMLIKEAMKRTTEMSERIEGFRRKRQQEEYDREYNRLSSFLGGEGRAERLIEGERTDPVIRAAVQGQLYRSMMDNGDLNVRPELVQPPPDFSRRRRHAP